MLTLHIVMIRHSVTRGDCGHRVSLLAVANIYNETLTISSACPVINHQICSGNGNLPNTYLTPSDIPINTQPLI